MMINHSTLYHHSVGVRVSLIRLVLVLCSEVCSCVLRNATTANFLLYIIVIVMIVGGGGGSNDIDTEYEPSRLPRRKNNVR